MTAPSLIRFALDASIILLVFATGLRASVRDATYLFRHPKQYLSSILSMNVVMTAFAAGLAVAFDLPQATKIALVALALSPVPPVLPMKQTRAGGSEPYALGLLIGAAATAILLVPAALALLEHFLDLGLHMPVQRVASLVFVTTIGPTVAGIAVRGLAPAFAERIAGPLSSVALVLLPMAALPVLIFLWPQLQATAGNGTLIAIALFALVGLTVGHLFGGPTHNERTVLALATSARHPGMALAIASINFPEEDGVLAVVVWYLIIGAVVALPYIRLQQSRQTDSNK